MDPVFPDKVAVVFAKPQFTVSHQILGISLILVIGFRWFWLSIILFR